jgi:hypothetical protein
MMPSPTPRVWPTHMLTEERSSSPARRRCSVFQPGVMLLTETFSTMPETSKVPESRDQRDAGQDRSHRCEAANALLTRVKRWS